MNSTSQREHLTYSIILQLAILGGLAITTWAYIIPGVKTINANEKSAISAVEKFQKIKQSGLSLEEVSNKLITTKGAGELLKNIRSSVDQTRTEITKTEDGEYIDWLYRELNASSKDRNDLKVVKMLINSILPTMSPTSNSIEEEYITLKSYIHFIEKKFLNEYGIKSNIALGLQGISYNIDPLAKNVGSFDLRLDFRASNSNIQKLITYINNAGNPESLSATGITTVQEDTDATIRSKVSRYLKLTSDNNNDDNAVLLTNPLMTIESLSLENVLDSSKNDSFNNGRITIRFYVRGSSQEDITFLQNSLSVKHENLNKEIKKAIQECNAQDILCAATLPKIQAFDKKYNEFSRSLIGIKGLESTDISMLGQIAYSLRALNEEFNTIIKNTNRK